MKKPGLILLLLIFVFADLLPASAKFSTPPLVDEPGCLSETEKSKLEQKINDLRSKYDVDVAVYVEAETTEVYGLSYDYLNEKAVEQRSDEIFDEKGYGADAKNGALLLYISMNTGGKSYYAMNGNVYDFINDAGAPSLYFSIEDSWEKGEYFSAIDSALVKYEEYFEAYKKDYEEDLREAKKEKILTIAKYAAIIIGISLIAAYLMMRSKLKKMNTAVCQEDADNYIVDGSMHVTASKDIFLYSTITRTKRNNSKD